MRVSQVGRLRRAFQMLPADKRLTYKGQPITYKGEVLSVPELFDILTYDFQKVSGQLDLPETYVNICTLTTPYREAGLYEVAFSITTTFNRDNKSLFVRWRRDGEDWNEFLTEPTDTTDKIPWTYFFPAQYAAGVHTIEVEMRKEDASGTLNLDFIDVIFQRIG